MDSEREYRGKFRLIPASNQEFEGKIIICIDKKVIISFTGEEVSFLPEYKMFREQFISSMPLDEGWTFLGQLEGGVAVSLIGAIPVNNNLLIEHNDKKFIVKILLIGCHFASWDKIKFCSFQFSCTALGEWLGNSHLCSRISDEFMVEIRNGASHMLVNTNEIEMETLIELRKKLLSIAKYILLTELLFDDFDKFRLILSEGKTLKSMQ